MKKKPIERINRIGQSVHDIYLLGLEMDILNSRNERNHKDKEIICALGGIKSQIDLVITDLSANSKEKKLHPKISIETEDCEICGLPLTQSNIHGWICRNKKCMSSIHNYLS